MSFTFRPAARERVGLLIGLAGASGSGKTYSALSLATGLAGPSGKIAVIDTEARRALHYADRFRFDHGDMAAPFSPDRYAEAIAAADTAGYDVIVVDSLSHEYEGDGGLIEWAAREEASGVKSPGNWKAPKTAHKKMVSKLLQTRAHLILCMRAEEKMRVERVAITNHDGSPKMGRDGKPIMRTEVTAASDLPTDERWQAICEKRFPYELTASFLLLPSAPGVPVPLKLQEQHRKCIAEGQPIGQRAGELLREWSSGGASAPAALPPTEPPQKPASPGLPLWTPAGQVDCENATEWLTTLEGWLKAGTDEGAAIWSHNQPLAERIRAKAEQRDDARMLALVDAVAALAA
jgi:hypothetical protein